MNSCRTDYAECAASVNSVQQVELIIQSTAPMRIGGFMRDTKDVGSPSGQRSLERPFRRIICEFVAVLLWPFECVAIVFFPLLPFAAAGIAEFERARARECGESVPCIRPNGTPWMSWGAVRVRSFPLWSQDVPLTLASAFIGLASSTTFAVALIASVVLIATPVLVSRGTGAVFGPVEVSDAPGAASVVLICTVVLLLMGTSAVWLSLLRDAIVRAVSRPATSQLVSELRDVRSNREEIVSAFELERQRIEQDLHDGVQQDLLALSMSLGLLDYRLGPTSDEHELVLRARRQVETSLQSLREIVHGVHPKELSDLGLSAAITGLCERSAVAVEIDVDGKTDEICSTTASALYFAASEALSNVARHAGTDRAYLRLRHLNGRLWLLVSDNGRGTAHIDTKKRTGLAGLRHRMQSVNGDLHIYSDPRKGTRIEATAPALLSTTTGEPSHNLHVSDEREA